MLTIYTYIIGSPNINTYMYVPTYIHMNVHMHRYTHSTCVYICNRPQVFVASTYGHLFSYK